MKYLVVLLLFYSCTSLVKVNIPEIDYKIITKTNKKEINTKNNKDYKIRNSPKKIPHYAFLSFPKFDQVKQETLELIYEDIQLKWKSNLNKEFFLNKINLTQLEELEFAKEKDLDAWIKTSLKLVEKNLILTQEVLDPINNYSFGKVDFIIELSDKVNEKSSLPFYTDGEKIAPLKKINYPNYKFLQSPSKEKLNELVQSSIEQELKIYSNSTDTTVSIDFSEQFHLPISKRMKEGHHKLIFKRNGFKDKEINIHIRAGNTYHYFLEWEEDSKIQFRVLSFDKKLILNLNNTQIQTNEFINNLAPSTYTLEYKDKFKQKLKFNYSDIFNLILPSHEFLLNPKNNFNFWDYQKSNSAFISGDGIYISTIDTIENTYVVSNPILPIDLSLKIDLFSPESLEDSQFDLVILNEDQFVSIKISSEKIFIFENNKKTNFYYKRKTKDYTIQKLVFDFNRNKKELKLYLDKEIILKKNWNFEQLWRVEIVPYKSKNIPVLKKFQIKMDELF
jgi:hypothetical protein